MEEKVTIERAIEICVENKIKGSESQLNSFKKNGRFTNRNQVKALQLNLECLYEKVVIEGSGKRGVVTLNTLKEVPDKRDDRRINNSYIYSDNELILHEYVYSYLLKNGEFTKGRTYGSWAKEMGLTDLKMLEDREIRSQMRNALDELHGGSTFKYDEKERNKIVNQFINMLRERSEKVVENSFGRLVKDDRIIVCPEYYTKSSINRSYAKIDEATYKKLVIEEDAILADYNMTRQEFVTRKRNINLRTRKFKQVFDAISEHLDSKYQIDYYFKSYLPTVINKDNKETATDKQGLLAHHNRMTDLIISTQRRNTLEQQEELTKKWFLVNMFTLLQVVGIAVPQVDYERELKRLKESQKYSFNSIEKIKKEVVDNLPTDF